MTRMWMNDCETMCRHHLLGEHKEIHQLIGQLKKQQKITGYVRNNCIEVSSIALRHSQLVDEMTKRGYNHHSPMLEQTEINILCNYLPEYEKTYKIDKLSSDKDRNQRCENCSKLSKKDVKKVYI